MTTIGISGQWEYDFSIDGNSDFLDPKNIKLFSCIEEIGNVIPAYKFVFEANDPKLLDYLKDKSVLTTSYGVNGNRTPSIDWTISKRRVNRSTEGKYFVTITGLLNVLPYITQHHIKVFDKLSSTDVMQKVLKKEFNTVNFNCDKFQDKQYWIQPNITNRRFIENLLRHSYKSDDFLVTYISMFNEFQAINAKKMMEQSPVATIGYNQGTSFQSDYTFESRSGFIAGWMGKNRTRINNKFESGETEPITIKFDSFNPNDERNKDLGHRHSLDGIQTENHHTNYWKAEVQNLAGKSYYSNNIIEVRYAESIIDAVKPMDIIQFMDDELDSNKKKACESTGGKWIVGKVVVDVNVKDLTKSLILYRPNNN